MLERLLTEADAISTSAFGVKPERGSIHLYTESEWTTFLASRAHQSKDGAKVLGLYLSKDHSSHILKQHSDWISTLYHERYGHGLYYQHSLLGQGKEGFGFSGGDQQDVEGFAVWMERYFCNQAGHLSLEKRAYDRKPERWYKDGYRTLVQAETHLTRQGMLAQMGMPKKWSVKDAAAVMRKATSSRLAVALPLEDPHAPLQVMAVTSADASRSCPWLRIREIPEEQFVRLVQRQDQGIGWYLQEGKYLSGDLRAYERARATFSEPARQGSLPYAQATRAMKATAQGFT